MSWQNAAKKYADSVTSLLQTTLDEYPDLPGNLKEAMAYSLFAGGKRVRPFLVFAIGEMFKIPKDKLLAYAAALECVHTYSLIHDDLPAMDDDDLRRGKPTCHVVYGEATAILAGDALQTLAFELISHSDGLSATEALQAIQVLSRASGLAGMCGGQAIDLHQAGKHTDKKALEQMHRLKTGALLNASIMYPGHLANLTEAQQQQLQKFADAVGLGFQVMDDILDVEGDTAQLGKPQGSDEDSEKSTYPVLMGLEGAKKYLQQLHNEATQALQSLPYDGETLLSFTDYLFSRNH